MKITSLLLIRHAHNASLREGWLAGRSPDVHLDEEGQAQATTLVERLRDLPLEAIYASPLERAVETAQPLAEARGLEIRLREGLSEVDVGDWTRGSLKELTRLEAWKQMHTWRGGFRFPGGESLVEMQARMVAELETIRAAHAGQTVAVVSHSDPLKAVLAYYLGLPLELYDRLAVMPASVTILQFAPVGLRLLRLNDTGGPLSLELPPQARPAPPPDGE